MNELQDIRDKRAWLDDTYGITFRVDNGRVYAEQRTKGVLYALKISKIEHIGTLFELVNEVYDAYKWANSELMKGIK